MIFFTHARIPQVIVSCSLDTLNKQHLHLIQTVFPEEKMSLKQAISVCLVWTKKGCFACHSSGLFTKTTIGSDSDNFSQCLFPHIVVWQQKTLSFQTSPSQLATSGGYLAAPGDGASPEDVFVGLFTDLSWLLLTTFFLVLAHFCSLKCCIHSPLPFS